MVVPQAAGPVGARTPIENLPEEGIGIRFGLVMREGHHIAVLSDDNDQRSCLRYLHDSCAACNRNPAALGQPDFLEHHGRHPIQVDRPRPVKDERGPD